MKKEWDERYFSALEKEMGMEIEEEMKGLDRKTLRYAAVIFGFALDVFVDELKKSIVIR